MRGALAAAAVAVAAACGGGKSSSTTPPSAVPLTPAQIAERALPSVVHVKSSKIAGTGFVVWNDGRIVTNFHVIAASAEDGRLSVVLPGKEAKEIFNVEVLAADPDHDLAILRVHAARGIPPLTLADSDGVKPGEAVVAIGHPLGLGNTVSNGIVSAVRQLDEDHTLIQVSAPISEGSSGGPIFNDRGEVIGVATAFATQGQNLNFGVPSNAIKPLLLEEKAVTPRELGKKVVARLMKGCDVDGAISAAARIDEAIKVGVPVYNSGDHEGCYLIYAETARRLVGTAGECKLLDQTLGRALAQAEQDRTASEKAWTMRHAFDRILGVMFLVATEKAQQLKKK